MHALVPDPDTVGLVRGGFVHLLRLTGLNALGGVLLGCVAIQIGVVGFNEHMDTKSTVLPVRISSPGVHNSSLHADAS